MESGISQLITSAICSKKDHMEWTSTFAAINSLNQNPAERTNFMLTLSKIIQTCSFQELMNSIYFIDAVFKMGNQNFLSECSLKIFQCLIQERIVNNFVLHNLIVELSPVWIVAGKSSKWASPQFINLVKNFSFIYQYTLDSNSIDKFRQDFADCLRLLRLFSETLISSFIIKLDQIHLIFKKCIHILMI